MTLSSLSEDAEVLYKTTDVWAPALERSIRWDDPELAVDWGGQPGEEPILSEKDAAAPSFAEYLAERAAEAAGSSAGCERSVLTVLKENTGARAFYEKLGYVPDPDTPADASCAYVILRKTLKAREL